jgi:ABC-type nitrate/sulfonate/bicarbonate transport system ATPase subunit
MKLKYLSVRNFRSYTNVTGEPPHKLALGNALNLLVGPNNCGKSNLLRAVALALQDTGGSEFSPDHDIPSRLAWAYPSITLGWHSDAKTSVEKTLLSLLEDYERSAGAKNTNAADGEIVLRVTYRNSARDVAFGVRGNASKRGTPETLERALAQFKKCVRFIYLRSGEGLGNFLSGTFRELLHTVRQEHLSDQVAQAQKRRDEFIGKLKDDLLTPLGEHIRDDLKQVMPEVESVSVTPDVPELEDILSRAKITIKDSADTSLLNKGTGVRGALLVALLTYLAKHSRRSLVLAVEEPESFLHPRAQQDLRDNLTSLARRADVSLLVTTHSPFMLCRSSSTLITALSKTPDGRTLIGTQIRGDQPHSAVVTALFGETITPALLDIVQPPKNGIRAILCVEGYSDKAYMEAVVRVTGRQDLLEGLEIRYDKGAHKAAVQAILVRQMLSQQIPVGVLFDSDEMGKSAKELLTDKFRWNGRHVFVYRKWKPDQSSVPVEAEDMFDETFLNKFVANQPPCVMAEKMQYRNGAFHYGFTQDGKDAFLQHLETELKSGDVGCWIEVLEDIRKSMGLVPGQTGTDAHGTKGIQRQQPQERALATSQVQGESSTFPRLVVRR